MSRLQDGADTQKRCGTDAALSNSTDAYAAILEDLELTAVEVDELNATVEREALEAARDKPAIRVRISSECECNDLFVVRVRLVTTGTARRKRCLNVTAAYRLTFRYGHPPDEAFCEVFESVSLPVIVWPFYRQLVQSVTAQMGIPPLTLPLQKL